MVFDRITINPKQLMGAPCIRGLRIPVSSILHMVAGGMTFDEIMSYYPMLEREDIQQALNYAAEALTQHEIEVSQD